MKKEKEKSELWKSCTQKLKVKTKSLSQTHPIYELGEPMFLKYLLMNYFLKKIYITFMENYNNKKINYFSIFP